MKHTLAIDVGGTYIKWAIIGKNMNTIKKDKFLTKDETSKDTFVERIYSLIESNLNDIESIGISLPGIVDSDNDLLVWAPPTVEELDKVNIVEEIKERFNLVAKIENDARAGLLGELAIGNHSEKNVVMVVLGTGIGGAYTIDGKLRKGTNLFAGEFSNLPIFECGNWSDNASTSALNRMIRVMKNDESLDSIYLFDNLSDEQNLTLLDQWYDNVGKGIGTIITFLDPDKIIISGGVTENENFSVESIVEKANNRIPASFHNKTQVIKSKSGNDINLFGAWALVN